MKRETNDSEVNHLLSFGIEHNFIVSLKTFNKTIPTTSRFRSSIVIKAIQIKYRFERFFPTFLFSSSLRQNFVFARLGSPAFEAMLKIGNEMS